MNPRHVVVRRLWWRELRGRRHCRCGPAHARAIVSTRKDYEQSWAVTTEDASAQTSVVWAVRGASTSGAATAHGPAPCVVPFRSPTARARSPCRRCELGVAVTAGAATALEQPLSLEFGWHSGGGEPS